MSTHPISPHELQPQSRLSMDFLTKYDFHIEINITDVHITKNFSSIIFSLIYLCFLGLWVLTCYKNKAYVHKIHILMGALLVMVTVDLIFGTADIRCARFTSTADGWDFLIDIFKFVRVVFFNSVIVLMCAGWSFLRPFLQAKDKIVVTILILLHVGSIVIRDTSPFDIDRQSWDYCVGAMMSICLLSLFFLILRTERWLDKACKAGGKAARRFEMISQFTWLGQAPVWGFFYIFFWRHVVSFMKDDPYFVYSSTALNVIEEIFSLVFCMALFYMFRPDEKNEYCFLDFKDEVDVPQEAKDENNQMDPVPRQKTRNGRGRKNRDQVSFSYPKLPDDFEW